MEILLWLAPAVVVTAVAMAVAGWAGRERRESDRRSEAAQARFAAAINRDHPASTLARPRPVRDRSTGIAVRPSRSGTARSSGGANSDDRRSA